MPCDDPFRRACEQVREAKSLGLASNGVEVVFAPGEYRFTETAEFGADDSGTGNAKIVYRAERPGETHFTGGSRLAPELFRKVSDPALRARLPAFVRDRVLVADLTSALPKLKPWPDKVSIPPGPWLYANGRPLDIACWPNKDGEKAQWATFLKACKTGVPEGHRQGDASKDMQSGSFYWSEDRADRWNLEDGVWLFGYWTHDWAYDTIRVASVTKTPTNRIVALAAPHNYGIAAGTCGPPTRRFYAMNLLEELDAPGEWWLDRRRRLLYLLPPERWPKVDLQIAVFNRPFVMLKGVRHVSFKGLEFAYAHCPGVALDMSADCQDVVWEGCQVRCIGGDGVRLCGTRTVFRRGKILYAGGAGVRMGGGDKVTLNRADNAVEESEIGWYGRFIRTYAAGVGMSGIGNTIRGCTIHDAPHNAVFYNANDCLIQSNEIYRVLLETGDAGAIYTGRDTSTLGNVIEGNYIHDLGGEFSLAGYTMGVYFDDCDWGDVVRGNFFERVDLAVLIGGGNLHPVHGNVMKDCGTAIRMDTRGVLWRKQRNAYAPNDRGESWYYQKLKAFRPFSGEWSRRYPELKGLLADRPDFPHANPVSNNVIIACKNACSLDDLAKSVTNECPFADNRIYRTLDEASRLNEPCEWRR